jgi:hypothetical protein
MNGWSRHASGASAEPNEGPANRGGLAELVLTVVTCMVIGSVHIRARRRRRRYRHR